MQPELAESRRLIALGDQLARAKGGDFQIAMHVRQKFFDRLSTTVQAKPGESCVAIGGNWGKHSSQIGCGSPVDHVLDVRGKEAVDDRSIFAHYGIEVSRYDFGVRLLRRAHCFPTQLAFLPTTD